MSSLTRSLLKEKSHESFVTLIERIQLLPGCCLG
jgi:hypothetical protein